MRVKIRSNEDVNNPELNAAILEQIKEKLKDHGMANSTVQWKEQPDGKVFQKKKNNNTQQKEGLNVFSCVLN
ncbi:hypothetical protein KOW79_015922 [Hemibagrus wyckioides]|uniref:Uncharacterized protein n=2 Tax=Hemibagrus wyckioides TaxID=337641 RepID=A0A9D3NEK5_9TELE|nr:hypothetical protein KOW79_015922 [Hemibagrus wyckioides]